MGERELLDERVHLVGQRCHTIRIAKADLTERVEPHGDQQRHRLREPACPGVRLLPALARLPDQAEVCELKAEHREHCDLRIGDEADEGLLGRGVDRFHRWERTLQRFTGRMRSAQVHACVPSDGARGERKKRIAGLCCESISSICNGKRLRVLPAQVVQETEPVQEQASHRVPGNICQQ